MSTKPPKGTSAGRNGSSGVLIMSLSVIVPEKSRGNKKCDEDIYMYSMPILLYGFEGCNLCKRDLYSLDFVVNRFFMKLFRTSDISVIAYCREKFQFDLPSVIFK